MTGTGPILAGLVLDVAVAYWVARDAQHRDWHGRAVGPRGWMLLCIVLTPLVALLYLVRRPRRPAHVRGPQVQAAAGWQQDPTGRHQLRFWDGRGWTDNVSDQGTARRDPL